MQDNRWPWWAAVLLLAALAGGCQTFRHDGATADSGPSRTFGLDYVPRQSEPPIESPDKRTKSGSRSSAVKAASLEEPADDESPKPSKSLARLLPGRDKEVPKSKPLPVSSRTASAEEAAVLSQKDDLE
jgi:hypothetical protein